MKPKIVCIGGGTGLPNLLRGLKQYTCDITAIVTVADDGGSSGVIRGEMKIPPPGDIKNCLLALADTETLMQDLFQYRFNTGCFKGHSFGNLFIAAMTEMLGDFELAIKESSKVLAVRGRVLPSTLSDVSLIAEYEDGKKVLGESKIPNKDKEIVKVSLYPEDSKPLQESLDAIAEADAIILGPGSLYTSIIPNLLVKDITKAICKSKAKKIYIVNIMTQPGETTGYAASKHVNAIAKHAGYDVIDYVVLNTENIPEILLSRYNKDGATPVICDSEKIEDMGYTVVTGNIVNSNDYIRHSPKKLAKMVIEIIEK